MLDLPRLAADDFRSLQTALQQAIHWNIHLLWAQAAAKPLRRCWVHAINDLELCMVQRSLPA